MSLIQVLLLGLVQGLAEFIPVSSSGHLVLVPWLFGWPTADAASSLAFDTVLHLGTLTAILAVFWRDWLTLAVDWLASLRQRAVATADLPAGDPTGLRRPVASPAGTVGKSREAWALIIATIPAVILGVVAESYFEELFGSPERVAVLLLVTAAVLVAGERWARSGLRLEGMGWRQAIAIGIAQAIAIAPGISRSGATISGGRLVGLSREDAARFSFLLGTPTIAGAGLLQVYKLAKAGTLLPNAGLLVVGFLVAAVSGYVVIRFLLSYLRQHSTLPFAVYCAVAGVVCLMIAIVR